MHRSALIVSNFLLMLNRSVSTTIYLANPKYTLPRPLKWHARFTGVCILLLSFLMTTSSSVSALLRSSVSVLTYGYYFSILFISTVPCILTVWQQNQMLLLRYFWFSIYRPYALWLITKFRYKMFLKRDAN